MPKLFKPPRLLRERGVVAVAATRQRYQDLPGEVERELAWLGQAEAPVGPTGRPADPHLPADITLVDNVALGFLYVQMVAMEQWLLSELAKADNRLASAAAHMEQVKAEVRLQKTGTVPDKNSKTVIDARYVAAELDVLQHTARTRLIRARVRGYEKASAALSREQTRREAEHQ